MQYFQARLLEFKPVLMVIMLSALGLSCVSSVLYYLNADQNILVGLLFMGFIFFIYTLNRYTDLKEDFANDIKKVVFFTKNRWVFKIAIGAILLSVGTLVYLQKLSLFHIFLLAIGFIYSYKMLPWYKKGMGLIYVRIKDIPLMKNLFVSTLWGLSVFAFPILFSELQSVNYFLVTLLASGLVISTFSNTLFDDILDEVGDKIAGTKTLPTMFGGKFCYYVLLGVNSLWIGVLTILYTLNMVNLGHYLFLFLIALFPLTYIVPHIMKKFNKTTVDILMELDLLIFAGGLSLLTFLQQV